MLAPPLVRCCTCIYDGKVAIIEIILKLIFCWTNEHICHKVLLPCALVHKTDTATALRRSADETIENVALVYRGIIVVQGDLQHVLKYLRVYWLIYLTPPYVC